MSIIKISINMQKSGLKEPIYLTKLKRKSKLIDQTLQKHEVGKENAIQDIQILQKSLEMQKRRGSQQMNARLNEMAFSTMNSNRAEQIRSALGSRNGKTSYRLFDAPASGSFLQDITQNISNLTLVNHSKISLQADTKQFCPQKQKKILQQPKLACLKARAASFANICKQNTQKISRPLQESYQDKSLHKGFQQPSCEISMLKEKHEIQMIQLVQKNKVLQNKVHKLQQKLLEKDALQVRVAQIQKNLKELVQQNQELYRINEELSSSQIKCQNAEVSIQTQHFPLYVQDSYCQAFIPQFQPRQFLTQLRMSEDIPSEDWFNRAKLWKIQLQYEKMLAINRQSQYRLCLDNIKIQHRQEMSILQNQLSVITTKYDSKCQQIKEKQGIISKYILQKTQ